MTIRIGVIGPGRCTDAEGALAFDVGRQVAERGAIVLTGGLTGVMREASRGAAAAGGLVVGLLPGSDAAEANEFVTVAIPTGLGEVRNALLVRASQAIVAVSGSWGTLSEIALAVRTGVPVVGLASPYADALDYPCVATAGEAVRWVLERAGARA
jgi:uncharacterized protein (TIGR00725 family)